MKPKFNSNKVVIKQIPNIGSCDYAYLTYIIDNYENLPDKVEFTKGSTWVRNNYLKCKTCEKKDSWPLNFHLNDWKFTNNKTQKFPFKKSEFRNIGDWVRKSSNLNAKMFTDDHCNIILQGNFGVTRDQIKNTNLETYKELRNYQKHANEEIDHYIERSWGPLFCHTQHHVDNTNEQPIYVLTRTSKRPLFFETCHDSVEKQTYKNWVHVISIDNEPTKTYVDKVSNKSSRVIGIPVKPGVKTQESDCPYNLYNNELLKQVPNGSWIIFLDDDGKMHDNDSLNRLSVAIKKAESESKDMIISHASGKVPKRPELWGYKNTEIIKQVSIPPRNNMVNPVFVDTAHICIKKTKKMARWGSRCQGDYKFYIANLKQGYEILYNDSVIVSGNYHAYGHGTRKDLNK